MSYIDVKYTYLYMKWRLFLKIYYIKNNELGGMRTVKYVCFCGCFRVLKKTNFLFDKCIFPAAGLVL
jgi:hypothetical protein